MAPSSVFSGSLDVPPGTSATTFVFFKDDPSGSFRLTDPSGVEAVAGSTTGFNVIKTPHVVVWRLSNPQAGSWRVDASGLNGALSVGHYSSNRFTIKIASASPMPAGEPNTLVAYVSEGSGPVLLNDVSLIAQLTLGDGSTVAYNMTDTGLGGDAVANDGYYSTILPALGAEGEYAIEMSLIWPQFGHRVSTQTALVTRSFPSIEVRPLPLAELQSGQRTKIATLFLNVNGEPYLIDVEQLSGHVGSTASSDAVLQFEAQSLSSEGKAWLFDVYIVPDGAGRHNVTFEMDLNYAGTSYTHMSQSMVITSLAPPVAAVDLTLNPAALPFMDSLVVPGWVIVLIPSLLIVLVGGSFLSFVLRTKPRGFLYNDNGDMVADFSKVNRHPVMNYLFRNIIFGKELKIQGFEKVTFTFNSNRVKVHSRDPQPGVRVNNEPLSARANVYHKSWIGARGKLYSFLFSKPKVEGLAMGLTDD